MTGIDGGPAASRPTAALVGAILTVTLLAVGTAAAIWGMAVPAGPEVCALVYPAPRNCFVGDRQSAAIAWTVVVAVAYLLSLVAVVLLVPRWRWFVVAAAGGALLMLGLAAFVATAWIPALA